MSLSAMRFLALTIVWLIAAPHTGWAQTEDLAALNRQVAQLYRQGRYLDAINVAERALAIAEKKSANYDPDVTTALDGLARLYVRKDRYQEAEALYKRLLSIRERNFGPDHVLVSLTLSDLAGVYLVQRRYGEAEQLFRRSLAIREKVLGPDHSVVGQALKNLAILYTVQGRYAEAEPLEKRSLSIREKVLGPDDPSFGPALDALAYLYRNLGRNADAEPLLQRSLAVREKTLGRNHLDVSAALVSLASLYRAQSRYSDAEPLFKRSLSIREKALGRDHKDVGSVLQDLAVLYRLQSRYVDAEPLFKRSLSIHEKAFGPDHPDVAQSLNDLANNYQSQGRYGEAERLYRRSLAISEKKLGPGHLKTATLFNNLGELHRQQGRHAEAEQLFRRSLAIRENTLEPDHLDVGVSLNNLALLYRDQSRYSDAEPLHKRALRIIERTLGADHPKAAVAANNLAQLYTDQGRYAEAETLLKRSIAILEKALGPNDVGIGNSLNNLAGLYQKQGRYAEAGSLYKQVLLIFEKKLGADHPDAAVVLNNLALLYSSRGRYAEAEPLRRRVLLIFEKKLGADHPDVGQSLNNLAKLYEVNGRFSDAEPLHRRNLEITEKALGPGHPAVALSLTNLAVLYADQGRYAEAEPLQKRSLEIRETALGPDHPDVGTTLNSLAKLYHLVGNHGKAEPLFNRSLRILEKKLGPDHPWVAVTLNNLAALYVDQRRYRDAEPLFKRHLAIFEMTFGKTHPGVSAVLSNLAVLYERQGDWKLATEYYRRSTSIIARRTRLGSQTIGQGVRGQKKSEAERSEFVFKHFVKSAYRSRRRHDDTSSQVAAEMFQTAQWAIGSGAAASLAKMAARQATGNPQMAALVRERQDLISLWQKRDWVRNYHFSQRPSKRSKQLEANNASRLAAIDAQIAKIDQRLSANFPDYASFANPAPLKLSRVQKLLKANEALVHFLDTEATETTPEETFVWVVTKTASRWVRSSLGTTALRDHVDALRCGLDFEGAWTGARCFELLNAVYTDADRWNGRALPFQLQRAHKLYRALFGRVAKLIGGKDLLIVPSGPLTQLPFQVLVTKKPEENRLDRSAFQKASWLARHHAITILPSVSSLAALRAHAQTSKAQKPFVAFGNPLLDGDASAAKLARSITGCANIGTVRTAQLRGKRSGVLPMGRGSRLADLSIVRSQVALPETADELCAVARALGARNDTVYLGQRATEGNIKSLSYSGNLANYRVVHFATHGALAGELKGSNEPGLVLSPPSTPTATDDGYLSASEIANLNLDADWVLLSACNTAGGESKSAEALSGLAKAFFYAGARSLLVSHWYVDSQATVALITKAFDELKSDPKIGRAGALRAAMLSLIQDDERAWHPAYWAPFVVVGEGATYGASSHVDARLSRPTRSGPPSFQVHVASERSKKKALAKYSELRKRLASAVRGKEAVIKRVDLGTKGVWYRLLLAPALSLNDARKECALLRNAGAKYCAPTRVQ